MRVENTGSGSLGVNLSQAGDARAPAQLGSFCYSGDFLIISWEGLARVFQYSGVNLIVGDFILPFFMSKPGAYVIEQANSGRFLFACES